MAELVRRSLELLISQYPEPDKTVKSWQMPKAFDLGWRDLTDEEIKEQAQMSSIVTTQAIHFSNAKRAIPAPQGGRNSAFRGKY